MVADLTFVSQRLDQILQTYVHNDDFVDNYVMDTAFLLQLLQLLTSFNSSTHLSPLTSTLRWRRWLLIAMVTPRPSS